jgi:hypothetical protein
VRGFWWVFEEPMFDATTYYNVMDTVLIFKLCHVQQLYVTQHLTNGG